MTPPAGPAVLDASAVLAWLRAEPGAEVVDEHPPAAVRSPVNLAEVHQKLAQHGVDADHAVARVRTIGIRIEPFDIADATAAAKL